MKSRSNRGYILLATRELTIEDLGEMDSLMEKANAFLQMELITRVSLFKVKQMIKTAFLSCRTARPTRDRFTNQLSKDKVK